MSRITITGASGEIAGAIRPLLHRHGLRLVDLRAPEDLARHEEFVRADVTDVDAMTDVCAGAELVVHLGGFRQERPLDDILRVNVGGTHAVLEGARLAGVPTVLLAGSVHAVGYTTVAESRDRPVPDPRPDSLYGVGKVAAEALGSLYADRFGMAVITARIAAFLPRPTDRRGLSLWCSPGDLARLVEACLGVRTAGHRVVWGVSANSRAWVDRSADAEIGFHPLDDAEAFAEGITGLEASDEDAAVIDATPLGGDSVLRDRPLGTDWDPRAE
jgi:hypothetical protein